MLRNPHIAVIQTDQIGVITLLAVQMLPGAAVPSRVQYVVTRTCSNMIGRLCSDNQVIIISAIQTNSSRTILMESELRKARPISKLKTLDMVAHMGNPQGAFIISTGIAPNEFQLVSILIAVRIVPDRNLKIAQLEIIKDNRICAPAGFFCICVYEILVVFARDDVSVVSLIAIQILPSRSAAATVNAIIAFTSV
ncbi:hypothetical protein LP7551_05061 [Roseibium album]|nr:hypothetical protein LP7551_05061 [Roseibium album]